jgi:hypothetical protein
MITLDSKNTYWNNNGLHQVESERFNSLVPLMGKCDTVEGELNRAASKIYHDYYNNGFGNNWSGAWKFLYEHQDELKIETELNMLWDYRRGVTIDKYDTIMMENIENLVNKVIEYIMSKNGNYMLNDVDMLDMSEDDAPWNEEVDPYYEDEESED